MAGRPPYQPWYEGDFWSLRVRGQHWLVRLMYRAMLQGGWDLDPPGRIPNDDDTLRALAGNPPEEVWKEHKEALLNMFDLSKDEKFFTNQRQVDELKKYKTAAKKRKERASKGGKAKAINRLLSSSNSASSRIKQSKNVLTSANQNHNQNHNQNQVLKTSCAESSSAPTDPLFPQVQFITLPCNDGTEFPILEAEVEHWAKLYPAVDVKQELRNMRGWCEGSPKQRKTASGMKRFVASWLSRAQNNPSGAAKFAQQIASRPPVLPQPKAPDAIKELDRQLAETKPN